MYLALGVLTWKLSAKMHWFNEATAYSIYAALAGLFIFQTWKIIHVNQSIFKTEVPEMQRYAFKQVAILSIAYALTFGAELAVVSMLPLYYVDTFNVAPVKAGILAGIYPVINLFARPAGGWLSDKIGRKLTLGIVSAGAAFSFFILGKVTSDWPLWLVVGATVLGGIFSKAGSGAVYAMVPLIQRRMTGQFAGMVGAGRAKITPATINALCNTRLSGRKPFGNHSDANNKSRSYKAGHKPDNSQLLIGLT